MKSVEFTSYSKKDIENIYALTKFAWGEVQAKEYTGELFKAAETIGKFAQIGKSEKLVSKDLRSYKVNKHLIFYRDTTTCIEIVAILHERMSVENYINTRLKQ